jgi:DnaK suppressor protein
MDQGPQEELDRLAGLLDEIEAAMERIDGGLYGRCEACGGEIDASLLDVDPLARTCRNCEGTRSDG